MSQHTAVLLLGSNINNPKNQIEDAIINIVNIGCEVVKQSKILVTKPVEFESSNNFCNIALEIKSCFSPCQLLHVVKQIEKDMGRLADSSHYMEYRDRIIDIDIVTFNGIFFKSESLTIPHVKHLYERDFSRELLLELKNL